MKQYIGDVMLLFTAFIWGSGFVVTDIALEYLTPYQVMAGRFSIATIFILLFFGYKLKHVKQSTIIKGSILGVFLFLAFTLQTIGLQYTTPTKNAFLTAVNVIFVPVIAYLILKRKIDYHEIAASIIVIVGIGLLTLSKNLTINSGDLLSICCALAFAFDIFYTNRFSKKEDPILLTIFQFITASSLSIISIFITGEVNININMESASSILYLAIFSTMLAYILQNNAHKYTTATKAAIILSTESLFGMLLSILFLNEVLTVRMFFGLFLVMLAILISEVKPTLNTLTKFKVLIKNSK